MKILALIPARRGSKRVPRKNTRVLGHRPLVEWSINFAKHLPLVVNTLVSTDDEEVLEIAGALGALAPWLRPPELSSDVASSVDVALHALDYYESAFGSVDGVLLLQPTSPFRRATTIQSVIDLFCNGHEAVFCVSPTSAHPDWCIKIHGGKTEPFNAGDGLTRRSQDLEPAYVVNGNCYLISPELLRAERSFSPAGASAVVVEDEVEAIDIDTEWDWLCAEKALEAGLVDSRWP